MVKYASWSKKLESCKCENRMILGSLVLTYYQRVADRRTLRFNYALGL